MTKHANVNYFHGVRDDHWKTKRLKLKYKKMFWCLKNPWEIQKTLHKQTYDNHKWEVSLSYSNVGANVRCFLVISFCYEFKILWKICKYTYDDHTLKIQYESWKYNISQFW